MLSVCLKDIIFHSFHGLYPGEREVGGKFIVNVKTLFIPLSNPIQKITETLNYEALYKLVKYRMDYPTDLIETVSMQIASDIQMAFPEILQIQVSIEKCNPPISSIQGSVLVEYIWNNSDFDNG